MVIFAFFYSDDLSFIEKKVSVDAVNRTVESILDEILKNSNLTYQIEENGLIIIVPNYSKESEITGKITDVNGEEMPGVNVIIKGSRTGVVSDIYGNYQIIVPANKSTLVFSFLGYITKRNGCRQSKENQCYLE